jgi:electron transfer flavoprotein alpha subunit
LYGQPNVTPSPTPRVIALLIAERDDAHELARHAEDVLNETFARAPAQAGPPDVLAVCVTRRYDPQLVESLLRLALRTIVAVTVPDLRAPVQAADLASVLERTLAAQALGPHDFVCAPASALGEEVAGRLAAACGGVAFGRIQQFGFDHPGAHAHRTVFGGRASVRVQARTGPWFGGLRAQPGSANKPSAVPGATVLREEASVPHDADEITLLPADAGRRPVETARVVVSGGRGMQGAEGFALLEQLATRLDGAVGGSLPAVDAGWVPVTHQVGQSGKFVSPEVYVAVGISGTPQHLAGIGSATRIVAINNDEDADIFRAADLGIVADWHTFVPALIARIDAARCADAGSR